MDSVQEEVGTLVVLVRTAGRVYAITREAGELVFQVMRTGVEPCPLDQNAALKLLRRD